MLLWFVQGNFGETGSIKSDSGSASNNDSGKEELIKDDWVDSC
jgi:hypothetical protein